MVVKIISVRIDCSTRLRFYLKDDSKAQTKKIEDLDGVITVVNSAGQYQVVIGNSVGKVYDALVDITGPLGESDSEASKEKDTTPKKKGNILNRLIGFLSGSFTPFIGAIAGAGILKGLLSLFVALHWMSTTSGAYKIWYAAGDSVFYFLPVLLAFTAAKQLKVNQFVSVALGLSLVYPSIVQLGAKNITLSFFGIPVVPTTYTSTVIPILLAVWALSYLEPLLNKIFPEAVRNIFTPLFSLMIMVPLTLIVVGPIGSYISNWLATGVSAIYKAVPVIAGALVGALWQVFVIFGVHWAFLPLALGNIAKLGYDPLLPITATAVLAQAGAALGVFLKTKDEKMKGLAGSGTITALFGITEPTIYGVTLKLKGPFYCSMIGGGIGGIIAAMAHAVATSFTMPSLLALPTYLGKGFVGEVIGIAVAFLVSAVLTYFFGVKNDQPAKTTVKPIDPKTINPNHVYAPVEGTIVPLKNVKDQVFASGAMGKGIAVVPSSDIVKAPIAGTVSALYPTGHAIGITSNNGIEVLIHIGINTVKLNGKHFKKLVKQNDHVKVGQPLVQFDYKAIKKDGYDPTVMMIITNSKNYKEVNPAPDTYATNQALLALVPIKKDKTKK